jgi:hypothetical protein
MHEIGCIDLRSAFYTNDENFVSTVTTHKTMTAMGISSSLQGSKLGNSPTFASIATTRLE